MSDDDADPGPALGLDALSEDRARELLTSCLSAPGWVEGMLAGRPYADRETAMALARTLADRLGPAEVETALARHPRIAERAGEGHDVAFSSAEQSGVDPSDEAMLAAVRAGNAAYEERFGRVFLVRAAGRSSQEILAELERRLQNPPDVEQREVVGQLTEIALIRLAQVIAEQPSAQDTDREERR